MNKKLILLINKIFILFFFTLNLKSNPTKEIKVDWNSVNGAFNYSFQLKDKNEKILVNQKILENSILLNLANGTYLYRVGAINRKGKIFYSKWIPLEIKFSFLPEVIEPLEINEVNTKAKRMSIKFKGNNFQEESKVHILNLNDKLPTKILNWSKEEIEVEIDLKNRSKENYSLILENPNNRKFIKENFLEFKDVVSRWEVTKRSAIFPGWGQKYRKDKIWHYSFFPMALIGLTISYYLNYNENLNLNDKFISERNNLLFLSSISQEQAGNNFKNLNTFAILNSYELIYSQKNLNGSFQISNTVLNGIAGIYLFNLIDALFFHKYSLKNYNEDRVKIYLSLYQNNSIQNLEVKENTYQFGLNFKY